MKTQLVPTEGREPNKLGAHVATSALTLEQRTEREAHERAIPMPSYEAFYDFLLAHYRVDRFEGRNDEVWGKNYSHNVARNSYEFLLEHAHGFIGLYECAYGRAIRYDRTLTTGITAVDLARDRMMQAERDPTSN